MSKEMQLQIDSLTINLHNQNEQISRLTSELEAKQSEVENLFSQNTEQQSKINSLELELEAVRAYNRNKVTPFKNILALLKLEKQNPLVTAEIEQCRINIDHMASVVISPPQDGGNEWCSCSQGSQTKINGVWICDKCKVQSINQSGGARP